MGSQTLIGHGSASSDWQQIYIVNDYLIVGDHTGHYIYNRTNFSFVRTFLFDSSFYRAHFLKSQNKFIVTSSNGHIYYYDTNNLFGVKYTISSTLTGYVSV